jgi:hypothetical protein
LLGCVQLKVGEALEENLNGNIHFQASKVGTDATVDTKTESRVTVFFALDIDNCWIRKLILVTVCGRERKKNAVFFLHLNTMEFHVVSDHASHGDGRVRTKELFNCHWNLAWVLDETTAVDRV